MFWSALLGEPFIEALSLAVNGQNYVTDECALEVNQAINYSVH